MDASLPRQPRQIASHEHYCVLLVDDHQMMRLGLKALAQSEGRLPVRWVEAGNLGDAMDAYAAHSAVDLVLLDMNLPDSQGLQSLRRFMSRFPDAQVAMFSATEDEFVVRQAMALGAVGFVPKSAQAQASLHMLESLLMGHRAQMDTHPVDMPGLDLSTPATLAPGTGSAHPARARAATLSPTQLKVLELVLAGMSNHEIAGECKLAVGTVKNTVSSIMLALDVTSRSHLISVFR